jgi:predicted metal-dependent phosphoesterase TrpH
MTLRCLAHIHTRFSFDSWLSPGRILSRARESQIDVLVVTDHNTLAGSLELTRLAQGNPRFVIVAGEYQTEKGDIIGLFLKNEVRSRVSQEVIQQIKAQGGLVLLPHPYKGHRLDDALLAEVDLVETFNARCSAQDNARARELAETLNKPTLAGCDAHCGPELRAVVNEFEVARVETENDVRRALLHAPRSIRTQEISSIYQPYSQMIKAYKTRNPHLFFSQAKRVFYQATWGRL